MQKLFGKTTVALCIGVFVLSTIISYAVWAWQEPSELPPINNVYAPINVGQIHRLKLILLG